MASIELKKITIGVISIGLIAYRTLYFNMIKGVHDGSYYLKLNNSKDTVYGIIFGVLLLFCIDWQDRWSKYFVYIGAAFSFTLALIMLYDWLPAELSSQSREVLNPFYSIMTVLCVVLTIYLICYLFIKKQA